jgi:TetR/AcrR family transcriptional regulator, transcriptional repressor for nem operon
MKVSREQAAINRERILEVGTRLFREHGLDGIGVADLMREAGLTHGGFYGHFDSKEELMAKACERGLAKSVAKWESLYVRDGPDALAAMADHYLSARHRDHPGAGCIAAAVGVEAARHGPSVRRAYTNGVRSLVDVLAQVVPGRARAARRKRALATFAAMIGAMVLARAVDDSELSADILEAVRDSIDPAPG